MARTIFGGNFILDNIQNGLCGYGNGTVVREKEVAPLSIKTVPTNTNAPVPVQTQTPTPAPTAAPAPQAHQQVHPSTEAAMFMSAHAYVQALRAQEQAAANAESIAANQHLADSRHKGQVAFNKMAGEAIAECGEAIHQNSEAIRGLQHRAANAEAKAKAQQVEINAAKAELQKLKAAQAAQAAEIQKLKEHNKIQDKRLDNVEANMRKANAFMQKFGKKK